MEFNILKALEYYEQEKNITEAAKKHCIELGIPYEEKYRHRLSRYVNSDKFESNLDNETETETNQYSTDKEKREAFMPSAWDESLNRFLTIDEYCEKYGLDKSTVRSSKLVAHIAGHMIYNIAFNPTVFGDDGINEEFIEEVIRKHVTPVERKVLSSTPKYDRWFDRLVYTDTHVGMDVNSDGDPLYDGKWDKEELFDRLDKMVKHTLTFKKSNVLIIDDLGDFLDGYDANTTRKNHILPQNMNNKECFEIGLDFKIELIERLVDHFDLIYCNNICNSNHDGDWGYVCQHAFKKFIEQKYPNKVKVNNYKRFINHYTIGKHTFIITHGKDKESLKFGFPSNLDAKGYEKIDQYCKEHNLYQGNYIEFSMGDQHQYKNDFTSSNDFFYNTYPAFSPPSNWVKSNFKKTKSGFVFYNIDKESQTKVVIPYLFEKQKF